MKNVLITLLVATLAMPIPAGASLILDAGILVFKKAEIYYVRKNKSYDLKLTPESIKAGRRTYVLEIKSPVYVQEFLDSLPLGELQACDYYEELSNRLNVRLLIEVETYEEKMYRFFSDGRDFWNIDANECIKVDASFIDKFDISR
jgi:hypothetical protein